MFLFQILILFLLTLKTLVFLKLWEFSMLFSYVYVLVYAVVDYHGLLFLEFYLVLLSQLWEAVLLLRLMVRSLVSFVLWIVMLDLTCYVCFSSSRFLLRLYEVMITSKLLFVHSVMHFCALNCLSDVMFHS